MNIVQTTTVFHFTIFPGKVENGNDVSVYGERADAVDRACFPGDINLVQEGERNVDVGRGVGVVPEEDRNVGVGEYIVVVWENDK